MSATRDASVQRFKSLALDLQRDIRSNAIFQLNQEANDLVEQMKAVAPLGETGNLRKSIRKEAGKDDLHIKIKAGGELTTRAYASRTVSYVRDVKIGSGDTAGIAKGGTGKVTYDYSLAVEFGASGDPAHPFFWPSWRLRRRRIRNRMKRKVTQAIKARSAG